MNTTAAHPVTPEEIMAFFDGELSAAEAQMVAVHLDGCSECASLAAQFRGLSQSLAQWIVSPMPHKLEEAVKDFADKTSAKNKDRKPKVPFRFSIWNWRLWAFGGAAAVAGAFLLLGIEVSNGNHSDSAASKRSMAMMVGQNRGKEATGYSPPESLKRQMNNSLTPSSRSNFGIAGSGSDIAGFMKNSSDELTAPMIARSASLSITVKDLGAVRASLDAMLARHHGYSAQLTFESTVHAPKSLSASLRIPTTELAAVLGDLKTLGRVEKESQSGENVSQQHADLAERLKTARATEERFRGILQQRTGNISDVLEVEESIARVRGEIESMEAEQTTLEHRVDFATIDLQLSEEYKEEISSPSGSFSLRFHNAFVAGYRNATETVVGILLYLVQYGLSILIWIAIIVLPTIFFWRRYWMARSKM